MINSKQECDKEIDRQTDRRRDRTGIVQSLLSDMRKDVLDADVWQRFCAVMKRCVDSNIFQRGILIAILVNTLSMGIEHHNQVTCCISLWNCEFF